MRPKGSASVLEARRWRALRLLGEGLGVSAVSRRLACTRASVHRWRTLHARGGAAAVAVRPGPGRPRRLTARQEAQLLTLLRRGAMAAGFSTALWTTKRVAEVIARHWGVGYHHDHVGRLLHRLGWTVQKPERRAKERDERAIRHWVGTEWPRVKKKRRA
jgi:transposase